MQQVPVPNPPNLNLLNPGAWEWESGRFEHEGEEGRLFTPPSRSPALSTQGRKGGGGKREVPLEEDTSCRDEKGAEKVRRGYLVLELLSPETS